MASLVGFVIHFLCVFLSPYEIFKLWILLSLLPDTSKTKHVYGTYSIHIVFIKWDASLLIGVSIQVDGASLVAQMVKNCLKYRRPRWDPWFRKTPWRREWLLTVFLSGEFQGQRSVVGYSPWACKDSDMTEWLTHTHTHPSRCLNDTSIISCFLIEDIEIICQKTFNWFFWVI